MYRAIRDILDLAEAKIQYTAKCNDHSIYTPYKLNLWKILKSLKLHEKTPIKNNAANFELLLRYLLYTEKIKCFWWWTCFLKDFSFFDLRAIQDTRVDVGLSVYTADRVLGQRAPAGTHVIGLHHLIPEISSYPGLFRYQYSDFATFEIHKTKLWLLCSYKCCHP